MEDYFTHRNSAHRFQIKKVRDDGDIQLIDADGLTDESFTKIMRVFPHGFTSHSLDDAHMIGLGLGGRRDLMVALGGEHHEKRIKNLKKGESVIYDSEGNVVYMKLDKGISCNAKKGPIEIKAQDGSVDITSKKDTTIKSEQSVAVTAKKDSTIEADGKLKHVSKGEAGFGSSGGITYIGGDGSDGLYAFVETVAGTSTKVKAKV